MPLQKKLHFFLLLFCFISISCKQQKEVKPKITSSLSEIEIKPKYAKGFSIFKTEHYTKIAVFSPWPKATDTLEYYLVPKDKVVPKLLPAKAKKRTVIETPLATILVCSTTDIPLLEAIHKENTLIGFPESKYISSQKTRDRIEKGFIKDVGSLANLNTEVVLELQPELVVGFSSSADTKTYNLLERSGIPVFMNGSWLESHPLGRAEWLKIYGLLYNKEKEANTYFETIENEYLKAVTLAKTATNSPTVLSGNMYKDVWYAPGGNSYAAKLMKDANANYYWKNNTNTGSLSLSFESVYDKAVNADFWIGGGNFSTVNALLNNEEKYGLFDVVKTKNVYSKELKKGVGEGILYYELGALRADWVLKDLIKIFHPNLVPDYSFHFYQKLQ